MNSNSNYHGYLMGFMLVALWVGVPAGFYAWVKLTRLGVSFHEEAGDKAFKDGDYQAALTGYARARQIAQSKRLDRKIARARAELLAIRPDLLTQNLVPDVEYECKYVLRKKAPVSCEVVFGHIQALNGNSEGAKKTYEEVLSKDPENPGAHLGLALQYYRASDFEHAQKEFQAVLSKIPDHIEALIGLGDARLFSGESEKAQESYEKAITARGSDFRAHHGLGLALMRQNKLQEAVQEFQRSISLNPQAFDSYIALATLFLQANMLPQAEQAYRQALNVRQDAQAMLGLAVVLNKQGRAAEALAILLPMVQAGSRDINVLLESASAYETLQRKEEARNFYEAGKQVLEDMKAQLDVATAKALRERIEEGLKRLETTK